MTRKGWHGERQRHKMASKGLPSINGNMEFQKPTGNGTTHIENRKNFVKALLKESESDYNNYKTTNDQAYFIYDVFSGKRKEFGIDIIVHKGSNQMIVKIKDKIVFNSDTDKLNKKQFTELVEKLINQFPIKYGVN